MPGRPLLLHCAHATPTPGCRTGFLSPCLVPARASGASAPMSWTPRLRVIDLLCVSPYIGVYLSCLLVFVVGWSPIALAVALALYLLRMFIITAFYHRYFSHRSFTASRPV